MKNTKTQTAAKNVGRNTKAETQPLLDEDENFEVQGGPAMLRRLATTKGRENWLAEQSKMLGDSAVLRLAKTLKEIHEETPIAPDISDDEKKSFAHVCAVFTWDHDANAVAETLAKIAPSIWDNWFVSSLIVVAKVELVTGELQDSSFILKAYAEKALELINNGDFRSSQPGEVNR